MMMADAIPPTEDGPDIDRSIDEVLSAVDDARREMTRLDEAASPAERVGIDDELAEHLAAIRLQISVLRLARDIDVATDVEIVAAATEGVATAAGTWLGDPVIQERLVRMRLRDRAGTVTRRVDGAVGELLQVAADLRAHRETTEVARAQAIARRAVQATRACLEDAVLSVRHAG